MAQGADLELLIPLVVAFRDHLQQRVPSQSQVASSLERLLTDPATDFIVALSEAGTPVGYAQVRYRHSLWVAGLEAQLDDLFVLAPSRERGLGADLLEAVVARAGMRGCSLIGLNTNERNAAALRLYARFGFSAERAQWRGGRQLWLERAIAGA